MSGCGWRLAGRARLGLWRRVVGALRRHEMPQADGGKLPDPPDAEVWSQMCHDFASCAPPNRVCRCGHPLTEHHDSFTGDLDVCGVRGCRCGVGEA